MFIFAMPLSEMYEDGGDMGLACSCYGQKKKAWGSGIRGTPVGTTRAHNEEISMRALEASSGNWQAAGPQG